MKTLSIIVSLFCAFLSVKANNELKLWFDKPAEFFEESFVMGNGRMGAVIHGGVQSDMIYLNDAELWAGEPVDNDENIGAFQNIKSIREALDAENYPLAEELHKTLQGKFTCSYSPLGTFYMDFPHSDFENYYRELDISKSQSTITYTYNGVDYKREYFISAPDQVMVIKLSSDKKKTITFDLRFESPLKYEITQLPNGLDIKGYAPYRADPSYRSSDDPIHFDENRGIKFATDFRIINKNGSVRANDHTIHVKNASEVIILISTASSFNGFDKDPVKEGKDYKHIADSYMKNAISKSYHKLLHDHERNYKGYFDRVKLSLGDSEKVNLPTDKRLKRYSSGQEDKGLEILYFQYGRYLLISSSQTKGVPANLQGIWNHYMRPPWSSNYTININLQENYWPALIGNLPEMNMSLIHFIENLSKSGEHTAKNIYGVNGWCAGHNTDIWARTNPVGEKDSDPTWACWNMGGAWLSTHLWEHYLFTQDKKYLKNTAYDILKGATIYCLEWLIEDKNGCLITSPSTSPENRYITPSGFCGSTVYGATADIAIIRELFDATLQAAKILNKDADLQARIIEAEKRLLPYKVGAKGNLQEWYHDWQEQDPTHRHQSHLIGLYPGHHITPENTKELADACSRTLEIKGSETTGWSTGWRINLWARLKEGQKAYQTYRRLLKYVDPDNYQGEDKVSGGGTYPNLLDAHAPFQIDGNFGGTAGVIEMLMQSTESTITLLPALPAEWKDGEITGICARGGFEIDLKWKNSKPVSIIIYSKNGGNTTISYKNTQYPIKVKAGEKKKVIL